MLLEELDNRILILDGAMGTMLQRYFLEEVDFRGEKFAECPKELKGNNECLNLTRPDVILDIHRQYISAGADLITTNSFSANRISQSEYSCAESAALMARKAAELARKAADESDHKVWVVGSIGPTGKSLSLASDISDPAYRAYSFDDMAEAYKEQIQALLEGGADILLFETCFDALSVKAGLWALSTLGIEVPVMVSVSVGDRSGRTLTGQTLEAFYRSVGHGRLLSFGLNCSLGADELEPLVEDVSSFASCRVSCHPNAGLPDSMGQYNDTPEHMAASVLRMAKAGHLNIAGGCCGTTPEHISALKSALAGVSPRPIKEKDKCLVVSGLESVIVDSASSNFTNIGERTNVAGSRKFARLIASGDYDTALQIAADQIANGARIIDINMDDAMLQSNVEMMKFLRHIANDPAVARAAIMIDSSHWDTIVEGLKNAQGKCIVNSISLKEGEQAMIDKAMTIRALGAAMVIMAFDEEGQATTYERKISICSRAYDILVNKVGVSPTDIIFDVNVLSVGTGIQEHRKYGIDFINAVKWIKSNLYGSLTSGGISNLSFAFRGNNTVREAMHSAFLYHATSAGLDMGIVNPGMLQIYDEIEPELLKCVEDVILDKNDEATERLTDLAQAILEEKSADNTTASVTDNSKDSSTVEEKVINALVKGISKSLSEDILACLEKYGRPVDVIEGPLMEGMKIVGEYFGQGKMFLPQVVKSAKIMRDAVDILKPFMEGEDASVSSKKPKIVIATVKGDVHDIGKNITSIVLNCNGFEVKDLGVMVPKETIIDTAVETGADMIAVSGLITPSLFQMEEICREMSARKMTMPLFIGGATTSAVHTAVKLAPLYEHVFYGPDASASAVLCKAYMIDPIAFEEEQHRLQEEMRRLYQRGIGERAESQSEPQRGFPQSTYLKGHVFSDIPECEIDPKTIIPYFDWRMLYAVWGVKEDLQLKADAERLLNHLVDNGELHIRLALHFEDCCSSSDDEILTASGARIPMLRQMSGDRRSLADFLPAQEYGFSSQCGFFAVSVTADHGPGCGCPDCRTEYEPMLLRSVRVTLAEAASSWVDDVLARELPEGSPARIVKPAAGYYSCPDHTIKRDIMALIPDSDKLGIEFTETYAMIPDASICAFVFAHPDAGYPDIRKVSESILKAYAAKRGFTELEARSFLGHLL